MLELILKALERLIDLAKIREKRANARFSEIYKPSYIELQSVHTDYLRMFTGLAMKLSSLTEDDELSDARAREALDLLRHKRIEMEPVRRKLWALGDMAWGHELPFSERQFLQLLGQYFYAGGINSDRGYASPSTTVLQNLEKLLEDRLDASKPVNMIGPPKPEGPSFKNAGQVSEEALARLREAWQEVSEAYAKLQIEATVRAQ